MQKITDELVKESLGRISSTEDGHIILAWLKHICNWDSTLMANTLEMTQHHASIRGVWGRVRQSINRNDLKVIEYDFIVEKEVQTKTKKAGK